MGEGVCKECLSRIMVGFWNKRALLGNVFVYFIAGNSYSGYGCAGPNQGPCYDRKRVPNACSPPVRVLSRQIFRQCFVAWLGGWFAAVQPVFTAAFAAHVQGHFADPFWDLRHLRGPFFGPFCGPIFGTWFWVP